MIAVCIRIHRGLDWAHVRSQYELQSYQDKCLVVAANGCDVDTAGVQGDSLVKRYSSPLGYGGAANACLEAACEIGADRFAFFDAGDLYGSFYLEKVAQALTAYDACGQGGFYMESVRGRLLQCPERSSVEATFGMMGGTLAGHLSKALPFDAALHKGEDHAWCRAMLKAGRSLWSMSALHYIKIPTGMVLQ